jgi:hypothetical protein
MGLESGRARREEDREGRVYTGQWGALQAIVRQYLEMRLFGVKHDMIDLSFNRIFLDA